MAGNQEYRDRIFSEENIRGRSEVIDFYGMKIEIRQPRVGKIDEIRGENEEDLDTPEIQKRLRGTLNVVVYCTYVPGTDELVFDPSDVERLMTMPMSADFLRLSKAIQSLIGYNLEEEVKNLDADLSDTSNSP